MQFLLFPAVEIATTIMGLVSVSFSLVQLINMKKSAFEAEQVEQNERFKNKIESRNGKLGKRKNG